MKYTENYKLLLPDEDDFFDVMNDNKNMDTLDTALKELKEDGIKHASGQNNPHNVTAAQVGASNSNLLINWDFTKPVNQRGWTSGTANAYTIDRWFKVPTGNGISTVTVNDGYITIGSDNDTIGTWLVQRFENPLDRNSEYTISVMLSDGTIVTANTSTGNTDQLCLAPIGNGGVIGLGETIMFMASGGTGSGCGMTKVKAAKLEKGMVSTLKNDILGQSYGEELAACLRYYEKIDVYNSVYCDVGGNILADIHYSPKRIVPTFKYHGWNNEEGCIHYQPIGHVGKDLLTNVFGMYTGLCSTRLRLADRSGITVIPAVGGIIIRNLEIDAEIY